MSKKTLLEEGTVRRFMKLAEMEPLAGAFVNEMYPAYQDDDEAAEEAVPADATPAEADYDEAEFEAGEEEGELEDLGVDLVDDEPAIEMDAEDAGEIVVSDEEARAFLKIADKIRAGLEASEEETEELPAPDMGDMGEEEEEITVDEEPPAEEEIEVEEEELEETDQLVQEIARRVAKRLLTKKND
jgi:hypothetical protein